MIAALVSILVGLALSIAGLVSDGESRIATSAIGWMLVCIGGSGFGLETRDAEAIAAECAHYYAEHATTLRDSVDISLTMDCPLPETLEEVP